jgi:hypothetical protein
VRHAFDALDPNVRPRRAHAAGFASPVQRQALVHLPNLGVPIALRATLDAHLPVERLTVDVRMLDKCSSSRSDDVMPS